MMFTALFHEAGVSIGMNRLRTFLAVLGIVIGVGSVVLMVSIGTGSNRAIEEKISKLGANMLLISHNIGSSYTLRSNNNLVLQDIEAIASLPTVVAASPYAYGSDETLFVGNLSWKTKNIGTTTDYFVVRDWPLIEGEYFKPEEMKKSKRVIIIGKTIADKLFTGQSVIGQTLRIKNMSFRIIGLLAPKGQGFDGRDQDDIVFVPFSTMRTKLSNSYGDYNRVDIGFVKAISEKYLEQTIYEIKELMRKRYKLTDSDEDNVNIRNISSVTQVASDTSRALSLLLGAIASISLVVGGIGIMNIMLVTVAERTREIGIRKAIGASRSMILVQFLLESIIISVIGSLLGLFLGLGLSFGAEKLFSIPVAYSLWSAIAALFVAVFVGIISGVYPAKKAAKMQPIDALRGV